MSSDQMVISSAASTVASVQTAQLIAQAKQLIAIPSTADNPKALRQALDYIVGILQKDETITIERFEKNGSPSLLAYTGLQRPTRFKVLLNGHVDVISASPSQFHLREINGRVYGRGTYDMKLAALILVNNFLQNVHTVDYPLGLQIVTDEEVGGHNGTQHQLQQGVVSDFILAGEQTDLDINTNSKGICWVRVRQQGISSHGGYPWQGENALLKTTEFIEKLLRVYPLPTQESWTTTVNIAHIHTANNAYNRVPDAAEVGLDIRYIPTDPHFRTLESVRTFFASIDPRADIEMLLFEPSHSTSHTSPYVKALSKAIATAQGKAPALVQRHGASDVRFYSQQGMDAVTFGLQGGGAHAEEEYAEISSIPIMHQSIGDFLQDVSE